MMTKIWNTLYKLMSNNVYEKKQKKQMENLRIRIVKLVSNNLKGYLKCTYKPSYMSHRIFENYLVSISKPKLY